MLTPLNILSLDQGKALVPRDFEAVAETPAREGAGRFARLISAICGRPRTSLRVAVAALPVGRPSPVSADDRSRAAAG